MRAFVTSVGEPTTELCVWALERNGFDVVLLESKSSLADKLSDIYKMANEDFLRVDGDVIVNRDCNFETIVKAQAKLPDAWWIQFMCWGWFSQKLIYGGVQFITWEALNDLRANASEAASHNRPETYLSRIKAFYNPRRFESYDLALGIHGYGIKDLKPIIRQKAERGQSDKYDFELAQRMNEL